MDSKSSTKSSQNSLDPDRSDRSSGEHVPSTPAVTDDTVEPSPARQPQNRVFTFFKRLPAELRLIIWEFACASPGPRIHFLEPIADETHEIYQDSCDAWVPEIHWEISEGTKDPCFQWSGRELLSVCTESRKALLNQQTMSLISSREQPRVASSVPTMDIICVRAGYATRGYFMHLLNFGFGEIEHGYCVLDERPSPRRLALKIPVDAVLESPYGFRRFNRLMPHWLGRNGREQKFMLFNRLEVVYILDKYIKPRAHYDHLGDMPPEMYAEAFDGHHGSKFVAFDPEDKQAVQFWTIPEHCWEILRCVERFPYFNNHKPYFNNHNNHTRYDSLPEIKLRLLACVRESSQTQQLDDNMGFVFP